MYGLDLFSGIGGITRALEGYVQPVAYCENDRYAQAVLLSRMRDGSIPTAPIWDDVRTLHPSELPVYPDIVYGGFPCQDISVAGRGKGLAGERSGLFFEIVRLVSEIRPRFVFLENVPEITDRGLAHVVGTLTAIGYDCRWDVLCASVVGCPMHGHRFFLLAKANGNRLEKTISSRDASEDARQRPHAESVLQVRQGLWSDSPTRFVGMDHGPTNWVDRIKSCGNAVVPAQAREAFERLMGLK